MGCSRSSLQHTPTQRFRCGKMRPVCCTRESRLKEANRETLSDQCLLLSLATEARGTTCISLQTFQNEPARHRREVVHAGGDSVASGNARVWNRESVGMAQWGPTVWNPQREGVSSGRSHQQEIEGRAEVVGCNPVGPRTSRQRGRSFSATASSRRCRHDNLQVAPKGMDKLLLLCRCALEGIRSARRNGQTLCWATSTPANIDFGQFCVLTSANFEFGQSDFGQCLGDQMRPQCST